MRNLTESVIEPVEAQVEGGTIPDWVVGSLYRNGPGRFTNGDKTYHHLFDGFACVHKFRVENGKVFYSNRLLETHDYTSSIKENKLAPMFGTADLCSSVFGRFQTIFVGDIDLDNVNVNIMPYANEHLYALTESGSVCRIDPQDLRILETVSIKKHITSMATNIAHPHVEKDGSWIQMGWNMVSKAAPKYEFVRYSANTPSKSADLTANGKVIASLPSSHSYALSYFHSFAVTKNYIVFLEQTLQVNFKRLFANAMLNKPFSACLVMDPNWITKVHVINRETGEVDKRNFITDPIFVFHHINAFERQTGEDGQISEIVVDVCGYDPKFFDINKLTYEDIYSEKLAGKAGMKGTARRITIPFGATTQTTTTDKIHCEMKELNSNVAFELPTINYGFYNGLPYKYMYASNHFNKPYSIVKMNMDEPEQVLEKTYGDSGDKMELPSEPVFVRRPGATSEDDGVLLVMVLADDTDYLSVLDAKDMTEIARAHIPANVRGATTFHGFFAADSWFKPSA